MTESFCAPRNRSLWLTVVLLTVLVISTPASAEPTASAQTLFERGLAQMKAGEFATACPALEESYRLEPLPGTLFTFAECQARAGRVASASARFGEYLDSVRRSSPAEQALQAPRVSAAEQRLRELEPQIPYLTIAVPAGTPPEAVLSIDDQPVAPSAWNRPIPVDPGAHRITLMAGGASIAEGQATLALSEIRRVVLERRAPDPQPAPVTAPPPAPPPAPTLAVTPVVPAPPRPGASPRARAASRGSALPYVAFGIGAAGIVTGGVAGAILVSKRNTVSDHCSGKLCDDEGYAATSNIATLDTTANIGFAVGLVGLAAGVVMLVAQRHSATATTSPSARLALVLRPGATSLQGTW